MLLMFPLQEMEEQLLFYKTPGFSKRRCINNLKNVTVYRMCNENPLSMSKTAHDLLINNYGKLQS